MSQTSDPLSGSFYLTSSYSSPDQVFAVENQRVDESVEMNQENNEVSSIEDYGVPLSSEGETYTQNVSLNEPLKKVNDPLKEVNGPLEDVKNNSEWVGESGNEGFGKNVDSNVEVEEKEDIDMSKQGMCQEKGVRKEKNWILLQFYFVVAVLIAFVIMSVVVITNFDNICMYKMKHTYDIENIRSILQKPANKTKDFVLQQNITRPINQTKNQHEKGKDVIIQVKKELVRWWHFFNMIVSKFFYWMF